MNTMQGYSKVPGDAIIGLKKFFLNSWEEPGQAPRCGSVDANSQLCLFIENIYLLLMINCG